MGGVVAKLAFFPPNRLGGAPHWNVINHSDIYTVTTSDSIAIPMIFLRHQTSKKVLYLQMAIPPHRINIL